MNLALFDFDGTITFGDSFVPFVRFAARERVLLGSLLLSPLILGYRLGLVRATRLRAAIAYVAFRGRSAGELGELGARYASTFPERVRPEALAKIRWHREQGDTVVVVSASLHPYLSSWCAAQAIELICTELETRQGVLTGKYAGADCTGQEKARRVRQRYDLDRYPVIYAYGDTPEDEQLLGLASRRYYRWQERPSPAGGSPPSPP